jgi:chromate reductase, NAD(P)H dehydrogenase (quinone)
MKNILLFAGSNSSTSINKQLIEYTATLFEQVETRVIDLRDFEPPMFSVDLEKEIGTHQKIKDLVRLIESADGLVVSTPEHNGMPPAFLKNILDWLSRVQKVRGEGEQYLNNKPTIVMSTGPGRGGGAKARSLVQTILSYAKADFIGEFVFSSFNENFQNGEIIEVDLKSELLELMKMMEVAVETNKQ